MNISRHSQSNVRKSNGIEAANLNPWIELRNQTKSSRILGEFDFWTNRTNQTDRTQSNGLRSFVFGE